MSNSLKDQLLQLGFKAPAREPVPVKRTPRPAPGKTGRKASAGTSEEIDLAKAWAIRSRTEKQERIAAERERQEEARRRREGKTRLAQLLQTARLNDDKADIARHFEYGGKIRRIHVNADQLRALNAGELAVVQLSGRYHLVSAADGGEAERIMPGSLALRPGTAEPDVESGYDDPRFQVPDDLVW